MDLLIAAQQVTGVGAGVLPDAPQGTLPSAGWPWVGYPTDFVREHGVWKIWHLNIKAILFAPYDKSWVEVEPPPARRQVPPGCEPDRVPENPVAGYAVDRVYERLYLGMSDVGADQRGRLHMYALTSPLIEVAGDLRTAKGIWICPGHAADRNPADPYSELEATWVWTKYGCDFVTEGREWKIWHLRVYGIFRVRYDKGFADGDAVRGAPPGASGPLGSPPPGVPRSDRPSSGWWQYRPDLVYPNEPVAPQPYETFDESAA
jgi:hypothetical protein